MPWVKWCLTGLIVVLLASCNNSQGNHSEGEAVGSKPNGNGSIVDVWDTTTLESIPKFPAGIRFHDVDDVAIGRILARVSPRKVYLSGCRGVTSASLEKLRGRERIEELELGWCSALDDEAVPVIVSCIKLSRLVLTGCIGIGADRLRDLCVLEELRVFDLSACNVTDGTLAAVAKLPLLVELRLWACTQISIKGVEAALDAPRLKILDLTVCHQLDIGSIEMLRERYVGVDIVAPNE